jgi:hypothetical protein
MNGPDALVSVALIGAIAAIWYGPWQHLCTDVARQRVFEIRDRLFDMAAEGRLDFSSREYRELRDSLNQSIRFAHLLTWPYFLHMAFALELMRSPPQSQIRSAIDNLPDPATRIEVRQMIDAANRAMMIMMLAKSIVLIAPAGIVYLVEMVFGPGAISRLRAWIKDRIQLESERAEFRNGNALQA